MKNTVFLLLLLSALLFGCESDSKSSNIITKDPRVCSSQAAKNQALWDHLNDWYLWNDRLDQSTDPSDFASLNALLADVKSKNPLDRWSTTLTTKELNDYITAVMVGYGIDIVIDKVRNEVVVRAVYEDSVANQIGLRRGDRILEIDGKSIAQAMSDDGLESGEIWGPQKEGVSVDIKWRDTAEMIHEGRITQSIFDTNTVLTTKTLESIIGTIGYLVFDRFIIRSEEDLNQAFDHFLKEGVDELIVDLRYNTGGCCDIDSQFASQIGGANVIGQLSGRTVHNANHSDLNRDSFFALHGGIQALQLNRVVFLTTRDSASASEALINSLEPYMDVTLVGQPTHGKPVGSLGFELCDRTVLAINNTGENAAGFGGYFDGLPVDCSAEDTIPGDWGDPGDPLLTGAIHFLEYGQCESESQQRTLELNQAEKTRPKPKKWQITKRYL